jgi:phasin family protein
MTQVSKPRGKRGPAAKAAPKSVAKAVPEILAPLIPVPAPDRVPEILAATEIASPVAVEPDPAPIAEPVAAAEPIVAADPIVEPAVPVAETVEAVADAVIPPEASTEEIPMETINPTAAAKAQTLFTDMNARAKTAMEKSVKAFEDASEFNKANVEAIVESAKIAAKGFETIGQEAAEYGRKSFESATVAMKSLSSIKSPTDFFKLQSDFVRSAFDAMVAESSRSTEAMLKLAGEVAQPISSRAAVAVEKVKLAA